jgi:hypothetical protein
MRKTTTDPIKTALTIATGLIIAHLVIGQKWPLAVALVIGLIGMFSDALTKKVDFLWMKLAWVLSLIVPNILLSIVFFFILFPIALLSRLFGKSDPLFLKNPVGSVYVVNERDFDAKSMENTW